MTVPLWNDSCTDSNHRCHCRTEVEMDILNDLPRCSSYGCKVEVPVELEKEGLCVAHFLMTAESECAAIRREAMPVTGPDPKRRTEIEEYVSTSAAKLVSVG